MLSWVISLLRLIIDVSGAAAGTGPHITSVRAFWHFDFADLWSPKFFNIIFL